VKGRTAVAAAAVSHRWTWKLCCLKLN